MQGWYIGITAASQAVKAGSTPVPCSKKKDTRTGVFLFGMPRAGWNSLPQPARSASNPEVKAGLLRMALPFVGCREVSSSLVYFAAQSAKNKEKPSFGRFQSVKKACHCEPVRAAKQVPLGYRLAWQSVPKTHKFCVFRRFLSKKMRIPTSLRAAKQVPLGYSSE